MDKRYIQFSTAPKINQLMDNLLPLLTIDVLEFQNTYFDINTCNSSGLDNWGRILDLSRVIQISIATDGVFGFDEDNYPIPETGYPQNFDNGFFYNPDYADETIPYSMNDYEYRAALKFRYLALTTNLSVQSINRIMNFLLQEFNSDYKCIVTQTAIMQLTYKFNFSLTLWQLSLFRNRNILPVPAGVTTILLENQTI